MGGPEYAILANALTFLLALSIQMDFFGSDDEADIDEDPLYDPANYSDRIDGTTGDDMITADPDGEAFAYFLKAGNDSLNASAGADYVSGGSGNDTIVSLEGNDIAFGDGGDDIIFAGRDDDIVDGGEGNDRIDGSLGDDTLFGGSGDDEITGGRGNDTVSGGDGDDLISGDRFDSFGSVARGTDTLDGGAGNDTLLLAGADIGTGGTGNDLFVVFNSEDPDAIVEITDYVQGQDRIELRYEPDDSNPPPELSIAFDPETSDAILSLDGLNVLKVNAASDLTVDDVLLTAA